jgi:hypothetical protein
MTSAATLLLLLVPFVPGLRDIPRLIPVHRLIWRSTGQAATPQPTAGQPSSGQPSSGQVEPHREARS